MDEVHWKVTPEDAPERLDIWLSQKESPQLSRSAWQRLIREGRVRVNGRDENAKFKLSAGDEIRVILPPPEKSGMIAEEIPLAVLFEDEDLLVIDKPPGMVVHPGAGNRLHTLVHALLHHCAGQLSGIGGVERPGLVHRLDADTSGALVVAKNDAAHQSLSSQFKTRSVEKIYLAWVWGDPRRPSGRIDAPIGRHPIHRKKMAVHERGRPAITEWKMVEKQGPATLLECHIHTGRTHQIRIHCSHLGHPVAGDKLYGRARIHQGVASPPRQLLHAWKLSFDHPRSGKRVSITAPVPADFNEFKKKLKTTSSPK